MKITYLTAGAAGMFCGSCMHDNTLAAALSRAGVDVELIPTYTPIRTDERDTSVDQIFFGGINVFLQQKIPLFRYLPPFLDRFLDHPGLVRWVTSGAASVEPSLLGELTVSMLRGSHGYQRKEVRRLCRHLAGGPRPDALVLTNILIGGCIPALKQTVDRPVLVTLQGDDLFLESLPEPHRTRALEEIGRLIPHVDAFLVHSRDYAERMVSFLGIDPARIEIVPLGIDTADFASLSPAGSGTNGAGAPGSRPRTVGYLARLAPEKGLHLLVEAFIRLRQMPALADTQLAVSGWLGEHQREYAEASFQRLREAGLEQAFRYEGAVDRRGKLDFLQAIDALCVPAVYREPKGLYALEAMAAGVPVVVPAHGVFPELVRETGGGVLAQPGDAASFADVLADLLTDDQRRRQIGAAGRRAVLAHRNAEITAAAALEVFRRFTG